MGRAPCCDEDGIKKGPWTPEEDQMLVDYIQKYGHSSWRALPRLAGLKRCGKSCRLRWTNYLRPDIKRGRFTDEEDQTIIKLHSHLGNKWSAIAARLPGRTDNEIKNYWNTHLRKKLLRMGIDPATHKPRADLNLLGNITHLLATSNLYNLMSPWDAAQLARIQLLQTLLSAMTSNVSPIMEAINLMQQPTFNHYHFTEQLQSNRQLEGLLGGSLAHNLTPTHSNFSNSGIQPLPYQYQVHEEPSVSLEAQQTVAAVNESGYTTPDFYIYNNSSSSKNSNEHMGFPCAILPAIPTPPLVSSSPELASVDSLLDQINPTEFSTHSSTSTTFNPWGELDLDNQGSDCGWADIDVDI